MESLELAKNTVVGILKAGSKVEEHIGEVLKDLRYFITTVQCTKNFKGAQGKTCKFANRPKKNDSQNEQHHTFGRQINYKEISSSQNL